MRQMTDPSATPGKRPAVEIDERTIGRILRDMGKLKPADEPRVFQLHREKSIRFGEAARRLRLVSGADIQYALSVQFGLPYVYGAHGGLSEELLAAHDPFDRQLEALRDLRTQLLLHWFGPERRRLAIVSTDPGDGRSYIAANLAVLFAQLGERTLLIDADLRFPRQHRIFRLMAGRGLAHALYARGMSGDAEKVPYFENLFVLSAGAVPPNPSELVSRPGLAALLDDAARRYAVVLIDTPAWVRGSDAQLVAARAGGALLVARHNRTRLGPLRQLQHAIVRGGAQIAGSVLNSA
jgi:chain length determinant protein tyrosine kinase EpsG